jgi:cell division ATPase FtsA
VSRVIEQALETAALGVETSRAIVAFTHPLLASEQVRVTIPLSDEPITLKAQDLHRLQRSALHQVLSVDREPLLVECLGCAGNGFDGVRDPRGLTATRLVGTFHIVTRPMAAHRTLSQAIEASGLEVAQLRYALPAALAGMADEALRQKRVLLIDAGGLTTDIGLFVEGALAALRVIPSGALQDALAIAKELQVTVEQAIAWSREGSSCRKPEVRRHLERSWNTLAEAIGQLLKDQPRPDVLLMAGRAALADGFAEWLERATGISGSFCRSPRAHAMGDLSRQAGLHTAIGLLEMATRGIKGQGSRSPRIFNRLIDRTRAILTEYF